MAIFEKHSNFDKNANFSSIIIGADAPVLEVELNEMQQIQRERLKNTLRLLFSDGVKGTGTYRYDTNTSNLTIIDELLVVDGEILEISQCSLHANEGDTVYVEVWEQEVNYTDLIHKFGNFNSQEYVDNYLLDDRVGEETSRRMQTMFNVTTTLPTERQYLLLGKIQNGDFTLVANNMIRSVGNDLSKENVRTSKYLTIDSVDGSNRYKVSVSHKGELITELTDKSTPLNPLQVLEASDGSTWTLQIVDGELVTKSTPSSIPTGSIYLQCSEPYAVIYKLGVNAQGELSTAPICDLDLIHDTNIGKDITWSSYKISSLVSNLTSEIDRLKKEVNSLKAKLGGE